MKKLLLDVIEIDLGSPDNRLRLYVNVYDNCLSQKWLTALNDLVRRNYHLEKNYCFLGFSSSDRDGEYICKQINHSITAINQSGIGYHIKDHFTIENSLTPGPIGRRPDGSGELPGGHVNHEKFNMLHRYFEDLQGHSGCISDYFRKATKETRWHIRQLNLLCHEFESWALSAKKKITAPEWQRPSQLMCWLNAPRFALVQEDLEFFGIETMNRPMGGVYLGVNKAVGKHHWEVFLDEGRDSRIGELITTGLRTQVEAAGDFDIEWGNNPGTFPWQIRQLEAFRHWLIANGLDPNDKNLTIGHPQVGQIDLIRSFGTEDYQQIWRQLNTDLNVYAIHTSTASAVYEYRWGDPDYMEKQIKCLG